MQHLKIGSSEYAAFETIGYISLTHRHKLGRPKIAEHKLEGGNLCRTCHKL